LEDFPYVQHHVSEDVEFKDDTDGMDENPLSDSSMHDVTVDTPLAKLIASAHFNLSVAVVILLNTIQVMCEELFRDNCDSSCGNVCVKADIDDHVVWLILDIIFTTFFCIEFGLKFGWMRCSYFKDNWNRFDFFLVIVGLFGLIASAATRGSAGDVAGKTRIIRVARVLRTLRFLRIFRLFHAKLSADKFVSMELARHMKKIVTLSCFIHAQRMAQVQLVRYFGGNGKLDEANESEIARCILQSQVNVYKAYYEACQTKQKLGDEVSKELENLRRRKRITEGLSRFVTDAHIAGALSATETHAILHPLNHQIAVCMKTLNDRTEGVLDRAEYEEVPSPSKGFNPFSSTRSNLFREKSSSIASPHENGESYQSGHSNAANNHGSVHLSTGSSNPSMASMS
jgi:hypothetical protein